MRVHMNMCVSDTGHNLGGHGSTISVQVQARPMRGRSDCRLLGEGAADGRVAAVLCCPPAPPGCFAGVQGWRRSCLTLLLHMILQHRKRLPRSLLLLSEVHMVVLLLLCGLHARGAELVQRW